MKINKKYSIGIFFIIVFVAIILLFFGGSFLGHKRPNVILITFDALRPDHLGCYGYRRNTSANIDFFAKNGTLFKQAIAQATWTTASVSSIITSLYPKHEIIEAGYSLSPQEDNLIKILKTKGYVTALFSNAEPILNITFSSIKNNFDIFNISQVKTDKIIEFVNTWLNKNRQKPFFLWVYLFNTHWPYTAAPDYFSEFLSDKLYPNKDVPIAMDDGKKNEHYSFESIPRHVAENGITDTNYYIAKYDGEIKLSDEQIGKLLQTLSDTGLKNNTLIIFFSDHGESMVEHNFFFNHSHFLYDDLIRVPLIIVFPNRIPKKIIEQQVQLINIVPTIMEIIGIKKSIHMEGKSLLPLINGRTDQHDYYAFSETSYKPSPRCIRTESWKLIYNRNSRKEAYELYDLKEDPKELRNLIEQFPVISATLRKQLDKWVQTAKTYSIRSNYNVSKQEKEKIKSLGYIE